MRYSNHLHVLLGFARSVSNMVVPFIFSRAFFVSAVSILILPLLLDLLIFRPTLFRTLAVTDFFSANLDPEEVGNDIQFVLGDIILCGYDQTSKADIDKGICAGFSSKIEYSEARVRVDGLSELSTHKVSDGSIILDLASENGDPHDSCFARIDGIVSSDDDDLPFDDTPSPPSARLCDSFRVVLKRSDSVTTNWLVLPVSNITIGGDIGPGERLNSGSTHSGIIRVFSTSLQGDVHDALTGNTASGGFSELRSHTLNMADVVRFKTDGKTHSEGYLTVSLKPGRSIEVSAWNIAEYATISTYGMPSQRIFTTYFERLSNDELIEYWIAFAIFVFPLLLRSVANDASQ